VKALPLWQPWAQLVAIGEKRIETRGWRAPASLIGQRIAIHATKGTGPGGERAYRELLNMEPFRSALAEHGLDSEAHRGLYRDPEAGEPAPLVLPDVLPRGAVIATAVLDRCTEMTAEAISMLERNQPREHAFGLYEVGRFAWVLRDVEQLAEPVPFTGSQGIFDVPDELLGLAAPAVAQGSLL
jgi:hypothetical protein